ncbi:hypothetical protein I5E68_09790 [Novosphingobium sp. YJ-S2-02]|uniref:Uncharacterized protein n=1 Tax=Novosphingobium aureum TaxID=2792964 RepID=A0A931HC51_9SPHN|nr:hypothetical protein [Novosphingobium aureum]MBH0113236.1 hypothetical protein [Novosphingobium aureum]
MEFVKPLALAILAVVALLAALAKCCVPPTGCHWAPWQTAERLGDGLIFGLASIVLALGAGLTL